MTFQQLTTSISLNKTRIERIGYKSNLCDYSYNKVMLDSILKQIAVNLSYVIAKFDKLTVDELILQLRKNCIKRFERDFGSNTRNLDAIRNHIEKNKRQEAKSKLLFIHNQLWIYINSNKQS